MVTNVCYPTLHTFHSTIYVEQLLIYVGQSSSHLLQNAESIGVPIIWYQGLLHLLSLLLLRDGMKKIWIT